MNNEKLENQLNLALEATRREREKSEELEVGYEKSTNTWELIVKYSGNISPLEDVERGIVIEQLSNEYAIVRIPENLIAEFVANPEIEFVEKPKNLYFSLVQGIRQSCVLPVRRSPYFLEGKDVITAIIDSGIDYFHPDFRNEDGSTRILALWDQTLQPGEGEKPPYEFRRGVEFSREEINRALEAGSEAAGLQIVPSRDASGHGTHVAGIAAGNGRASNGRYRGVAYESELIVVKLGVPRETSFPKTTELMSAVDFCIARARQYGKPIALNLSFGNNYGSHSGNSLIETYLDDMANYWKTSIVIGSGNEGSAAVHTAGKLTLNEEQEVEIAVSAYEASLNLQIWKNYVDEIGVSVIHPGGTAIGPLQRIQGTQKFQLGETNLLVYYGEPSPYNPYQEIYLDFIPVGSYIDDGIWKIRLTPIRITDGAFDMWLPAGNVLNSGTGFLNPVEETTLTIPSTATKVITVGAYDARFDQAAAFSGRGYTRATNQVKPDLVAPGVEIMSCAPGGGYQVRTGTSMATPFVTGSAALLMQWGIVNGNDAYLYGEKMKAYLIRGARKLPGFTVYPNPVLGWGALCTANSIPR